MTEKQKQQIARLARKCGLSQSEYLRQRALGFEPKGTLPDAFFACCERLDRLCRPPFSKETNEQALALLNEMQSGVYDFVRGTAEFKALEKRLGETGDGVSGSFT